MSALLVMVVMLGQAPQMQGEVVLFPAAVQLNGKFTQTVGTFGTVSWRIREGISLQVFGGGNWLARESEFAEELVEKARMSARASSSLVWTWALLGGIELEPLVGTLFVFGADVKFSLTLGVGIGGGGAKLRVMGLSGGADYYGDVGGRFMAMVSSGLRVNVGKHFVLRAEIRDVMFSSQLTTINGCGGADAYAVGRAYYGSTTCGGFTSREEARRFSDAALELLQSNKPEMLVNVGAYVGAGVVF